MEADYQKLLNLYREYSILSSVRSVLSWDQETYMPSGAGEVRAEQISYLSAFAHERIASKEFATLLGKFVDLESGEVKNQGLNEEQERMVSEIWRDYHLQVCLPPEFVKELSKHVSLSQQNWVRARKEDDYSIFAPYLEKMIEYKKQQAEYIGYTTTPYDALLDLYEPGMKCATVESLFHEVREFLVAFLKRIQSEGREVDDSILYRNYPRDKQWEFGIEVLKAMGFDFQHGRQDISAHPFTTSFSPADVRLTTRIYENDLRAGLFGTIHEGGHGLYEQGLELEQFGTPFGEAISLGIHESQSRMWENLIGRSRPFWKHYYHRLQELFPEHLKNLSLEEFYRAINCVKPSLIRVEADEVTYNLHIMLRFDIEQKIINDSISVDELPALWDNLMEEYLGITPPSDADGILQDIHWSMGSFGYFPTYSLGNLYSVIIMKQLKQEITDLEEKIEEGEFGVIREWLRENIHKVGRRKKAEELIEGLTGEKLSARPFVDYIKQKFSEIYELK